MLRVGITGGIGSGKSTVTQIFAVLGVPIYSADEAAKRLMRTDKGIREAIIKAFGKESYNGTELNRSFLTSKLLEDEKNKAILNSIVHPATIKDGEEWMLKQTFPYALKEAAILFESGADKGVDLVIGVSAPEKLRIQRTMKRDGRSEEEVKKWMSQQMDEDEKMKLCDFIIYNDDKHPLIPQVLSLHKKLLRRAKEDFS
ncbi:MAG: dephospho-CoA kinase [Chitinophagaceae bacterium]|nr:dephospho-CoA kinase [Chitinophagaceae bacterium]